MPTTEPSTEAPEPPGSPPKHSPALLPFDFSEIGQPVNTIRPVPAPYLPKPTGIRKPARLVAVALLLGIMAEGLLYGQQIGIGVTLFAFASVAALLWIAVGERRGDAGAIRWGNVIPLSLLIGFFAIMATLRADTTLCLMNVALCLRLGGLLTRRFCSGSLTDLDFAEYLIGPFRTSVQVWSRSFPVVQSLGQDASERSQLHRTMRATLRGALLSIVPLVVFIALLCSADPLFAHYTAMVGSWIFPDDFWNCIGRVLVAAAVAMIAVGVLAVAAASRTEDTAKPTTTPRRLLTFSDGSIILGSVIVVFVAFVVIQFTYLFGGKHWVSHIPGLDYRTYARSGFFQLVWVAVLVIALITGLRALIALPTVRETNLFRAGAIVLIALTQVVLASAVLRMQLFESVWGATPLRVTVDIFIVYLAAVLLWCAVSLCAPRSWPSFPSGLVVAGLLFCATLDIAPPATTALQRNIATYHRTGQIDAVYLTMTPSTDAVPTLVSFYRTLPAGALKDSLGNCLKITRDSIRTGQAGTLWPSRNAGQERALEDLIEIREIEGK